jgi:hypothetical protein
MLPMRTPTGYCVLGGAHVLREGPITPFVAAWRL